MTADGSECAGRSGPVSGHWLALGGGGESPESFEHRSDVITLAAAWKVGCKGENRSRENSEAADGSQTSRETMAA